ncbi:TlpA family protein disulfide reductase [Rosistilla oblonga]|uniref:TlpA family protein disulfide reductase n=1 Tax=Rosistilla oblonga TaxID=2527990 RepID=UPI003A97FDF8
MNLRMLLCAVSCSLLILSGCDSKIAGKSEGTDSAATSQDQASQAAGDEAAAAGEAAVELTLADWPAIEKEIAAAGKPVVVDIWSTACAPCMQEFHGLVELHDAHGEKIRCISVCIDYIGIKSKPPETYSDAVTAFLKSQKATTTNFLSTTADSDIYETLELDSIPAVFIYAADGTLTKRFVDAGDDAGFTYAKDVRPFVEQMLASE